MQFFILLKEHPYWIELAITVQRVHVTLNVSLYKIVITMDYIVYNNNNEYYGDNLLCLIYVVCKFFVCNFDRYHLILKNVFCFVCDFDFSFNM